MTVTSARTRLRLAPMAVLPPPELWHDEPLVIRRGDDREMIGLAHIEALVRYVLQTPGAVILHPGHLRRLVAYAGWSSYVAHREDVIPN